MGVFDDVNGPLFQLSRAVGDPMYATAFTDLQKDPAPPSTWSKCNPGSKYDYNVLPGQNTDTFNDPYVIPFCDSSPPTWDTAPTWSCPKGATVQYEKYVGYNAYEDGVAINPEARGCIVTSGPPACPSGTSLVEDVVPLGYTQTLQVLSPTSPLTVDACLPAGSCTASSSASLACAAAGNYQLPSCPNAPTSIFGVPPAPAGGAVYPSLNLGVPAGGSTNDWIRTGADACVSSVYSPVIQCPSGYGPSPNGNDCLLPNCGPGRIAEPGTTTCRPIQPVVVNGGSGKHDLQ